MLLSDAKQEMQELKACLRKAQKEREEQQADKQARIPHQFIIFYNKYILMGWVFYATILILPESLSVFSTFELLTFWSVQFDICTESKRHSQKKERNG